MTRYWSWLGWLIITSTLGGFFTYTLFSSDKSVFLIGKTTDGHHQIELACENCHLSSFGGTELLQEACEGCHLEELKEVRDAHPKRKFTDPGNADRVAILDARFCVTCHREHREDITNNMGLTVPEDVCFLCHEDIGNERATHSGLGFNTCGNSGCHNFHDNRALFEDFLVENADQPWLKASPLVAPLTRAEHLILTATTSQSQIPDFFQPALNQEIVENWSSSIHANADVDCATCHSSVDESWTPEAILKNCDGCHERQSSGFQLGKHGMRLASGLDAMTPEKARIPMHENASAKALTCSSCHGSHDTNIQFAAVEACMGCHNSDHVNAYPKSRHGEITARVFAGEAALESAVSCATCHMPRESALVGGQSITHVQHNQNDNLKPNDKMLRTVCMNCHSLAFSIDALADETLISTNFNGRPTLHVESIDMAIDRRAILQDRDTTYH